MNSSPLLVLLALGSLLFAPPRPVQEKRTAEARIMGTDGRTLGTARLEERDGGVSIRVTVSGLPPGLHGFHIHDQGKCETPDFGSCGGHFNPDGKKHGLQNPEGPHAGDLPNLAVNELGVAETTVVASRVTLGEGKTSLLRSGGTSLVIHADPDDGFTDPAGNSGARIACGVIEKR
jgi:superoxide dismutase, Cu-Zn family